MDIDGIPENKFKFGEKVRVTIDHRLPIQNGDVGIVVWEHPPDFNSQVRTPRGERPLDPDVVRVLFPTKNDWRMNFWTDEIEPISDEEYETGLLLGS